MVSMKMTVSDRGAWRRMAGSAARVAGGGALALALMGVATGSIAQEHGGPPPGPGGPGGRPPMGPMIFGGSPAHVARAVDRLLDGLNATDAQRTQIKQIATAAAADLHARREGERGLHDRALQIFGAPSVDANAAEALRQQMGQQRDEASRRLLQAMLDVAAVLTPEQRTTLTQRIRDRRATMRDRFDRIQRERPMSPGGPDRPGRPGAAASMPPAK